MLNCCWRSEVWLFNYIGLVFTNHQQYSYWNISLFYYSMSGHQICAWAQTYTFLLRHNYKMSGHRCVWAQTCVGTIVSGHKCVWAQTCVGTNVSGHKRVWAQTYMGTNVCGHKSMCGHKRVWTQTCVGTNVSGHKHVWAQTCLDTNVCGHKRVWAQ